MSSGRTTLGSRVFFFAIVVTAPVLPCPDFALHSLNTFSQIGQVRRASDASATVDYTRSAIVAIAREPDRMDFRHAHLTAASCPNKLHFARRGRGCFAFPACTCRNSRPHLSSA